jgi:predicted DNA-binding protein
MNVLVMRSQFERLKALCERKGAPLSEHIRRALEDYLRKEKA